jgi:methylmalonyl-CoA mutase N-terminal domain/subunit
VTNTIDPLAGSYFVESLTNRMEREALEYIEKINQMGGMLPAIERGYRNARSVKPPTSINNRSITAKKRSWESIATSWKTRN